MLKPQATPNPAFEVNTIEYSGDPSKKKLAPPPPALAAQYTVIVNRYYFKDRPTMEAFVDHGDRLRTRHDSPQAVQGMLTLAESRGWDAMRVSGSEVFRQTVWLEGSLRGLTVKGYQPTAQDRDALAARQQEQAAAPPSTEATLRPATGQAQAPSQTQTPGPAQTFSPASPAAPVTPTALSEQRVARQAAIRDEVMLAARLQAAQQAAEVQAAQQKRAAQQEKAQQLREAFETLDKRSAMERFPELTRLYPLVAEANRFAKEHMPDAAKRAAFVEGIKEKGIQELARGETLPSLAKAIAPSSDRSQEKSQERSREQAAEIEP